MGSQAPLNGQESATGGSPAVQPVISSSRTFSVPDSFNIRAVDPTSAKPGTPGDGVPESVGPVFGSLPEVLSNEVQRTKSSQEPPIDDLTLGALNEFVGTYIGNGLNTIFRPRNEVPPDDKTEDNLLEINVTKETLKFLDRNVLGAIPNRGFGFKTDDPDSLRLSQPDVILRGIPYLQQISDILDHASNTLHEPGVSIHFEQGLFLRTPGLQHPKIPATISRLASIPHGTTINAQGEDPGFPWTVSKDGKGPNIREAKIDEITPFDVGDSTKKKTGVFVNLSNPTQGTRNRLPNNLKKFQEEKIHAILHFHNPLKTLEDMNAVKTFVRFRTFEVTTELDAKAADQKTVIPGGGTTNIAFLQGINGTVGKDTINPNANAVKVTCRYWVSVIRVDIIVPPTSHSKIEVRPERHPETPKGVDYDHPTFIIPLTRPLAEPRPISVEYVQIQYAQNVTLDFGPLSWPHVSVATLIPGGVNGDGKVELNAEQVAALGL